jgi:hypothetical protein
VGSAILLVDVCLELDDPSDPPVAVGRVADEPGPEQRECGVERRAPEERAVEPGQVCQPVRPNGNICFRSPGMNGPRIAKNAGMNVDRRSAAVAELS